LRILFDKNVPVGLRHFLLKHEVLTFAEMHWHPQLENGAMLKEAEAAGFDVLLTADQNVQYQQNLSGRKLALVVLGSNLWPVLQEHATSVAAAIDSAAPGSRAFIEMPHPKRRG
jgi:hypothetical protein